MSKIQKDINESSTDDLLSVDNNNEVLTQPFINNEESVKVKDVSQDVVQETNVSQELEPVQEQEPNVSQELEPVQVQEPNVSQEQDTVKEQETNVSQEQDTVKEQETNVSQEQETVKEQEPNVSQEQETVEITEDNQLNTVSDEDDMRIMNVCPYNYKKGDYVWMFNSPNSNKWWYMTKYINDIVQELYLGNEAGLTYNLYNFDFVNMTETNTYTKQTRKIKYFIAEENNNNFEQIKFLFSTEKKFCKYDKESNIKLIKAFKDWIYNYNVYYCAFEIYGLNYLFNFKTMEQINLDTRRKRTMIIANVVIEDIEESESESESESETESKNETESEILSETENDFNTKDEDDDDDAFDKVEKYKSNYKRCLIC